jgi:hypothetical protein
MKRFGDLSSARTIYFKGFLFLAIAALSAGILIAKTLRWDVALLLVVCIWASCRAYYFAFYVIEKYVDAEFRFRGLMDFAKYVLRKK